MSTKTKRKGWRLFCEEEPPDGVRLLVYVESDTGYWMPECEWNAVSKRLTEITLNPLSTGQEGNPKALAWRLKPKPPSYQLINRALESGEPPVRAEGDEHEARFQFGPRRPAHLPPEKPEWQIIHERAIAGDPVTFAQWLAMKGLDQEPDPTAS